VNEKVVETSMSNQAQMAGKISGRSFLIGLALFFSTIFLANGIMVYYALTTFDGVETDNAYRKGRAYNHVLEADAAQAALGWQIAISSIPSYANGTVVLNITVTLSDATGTGLDMPEMLITFWRPTVQGMDVTTSLTLQGEGEYVGQLVLANAGNWIARINATPPGGQPFVYEERMFVPPASEAPAQ
jgi:nitrogen fixation protein FixH